MLYFTGPKSVEWTPMPKSPQSRMGALRRRNPAAPKTMMPISSSFTARMMRVFSSLSASCPAVAEKRKNGKMKMPPARFTSTSGDTGAVAAPNANRITSAFLKTLSLSAPRNCVQKNGANRRSRRSWP